MKKKLNISNEIGPNAISMKSGEIIRKQIESHFENDDTVALDFHGVQIFATPFFNASVGSLLKNIEISNLQNKMEVLNLNEHGKKLLNLVIDNAIKFYSDENGNTSNALKEINKDID
ncbi:STAS-like domain-containing protein [Pseudoalteromonas distincta]|uniref:STAS-like domain-containing protein n=1 Tax=Pseudoalteromonas distincta TaxID=77608 RepID=UPI00352D57EE